MTAWPWGNYEHQETATRAWCFGCNEWCYEPEDDSEDEYWALCLCCREPLYVLRIAELETELARFRPCETQDHIHSTYTGFSVVTRGRKVYHKEAE